MGYKKGRLSKEDIQYIIDNLGKSSVEDIAKSLNRDPLTIAKQDAVLKFKPTAVVQTEPEPVKADPLDSFARNTKSGKGGIVQMTEASSELGTQIEGSHRGFKHQHNTEPDRDGVTTMRDK